MVALFGNTVVARDRPAFALDRLAKAVATTRGLRGDRPSAEETAGNILELAAADPSA